MGFSKAPLDRQRVFKINKTSAHEVCGQEGKKNIINTVESERMRERENGEGLHILFK